jgi:hypothetical protein
MRCLKNPVFEMSTIPSVDEEFDSLPPELFR